MNGEILTKSSSKNNFQNESDLFLKNESIKNRYYILDNIKGILIILVVFGHFLYDYSNNHINSLSRKIVIFIFSFHMPAFIFISGLLSSDNSTKFSNAIKLIILYYLFNNIQSLFLFFFFNIQINFLIPSYSFWYLLSLFYWRISIKFLNKIKFVFFISIIITLLEGYWSCFNNILSIVRTIAFFPFYLVGFKMSNMNLFNKILVWRNSMLKFIIFFLFFIFFLSVFAIYISNNNITNGIFLMLTYNKNNTIKDRIFIIFLSSLMIMFNILLLPNFKIPLISKFGKNSLYIYLFHRILTIIIGIKFSKNPYYQKHIIEISLFLSFAISLIIGSNIVSNFCNSILNSIHKNLLEYNKNGNVIGFVFSLFFVFLLLIKPINDFNRI